MLNKKGAMFGLDARIALAIFGALSVISGAALYSAIQEARVFSVITQVEEIAKAIEAYNLDTAQDLPLSSANFDLEALLESSVDGWKGPYLSITDDIDSNENLPSIYGVDYRARKWPDSQIAVCSSSNTPCYYYIELNTLGRDLVEKIKLKLDGDLDFTKGKVIENPSAPNNLYYKAHITLLQP
tara:strand:- start:583 stop:1134 length:552 start_codon:yes stop_codon:yes gene_type:complete